MTQSIPEARLKELAIRLWGMSEAEVAQLSLDELGRRATGDPKDAAALIVYLASDKAADVNGQLFFCGSGTKELSVWPDASIPARTVYTPKDHWTVDDIARIFPVTVGAGLVNPAPPAPPKEKEA